MSYDLKDRNLLLVSPYTTDFERIPPLYVIHDYIYFGATDHGAIDRGAIDRGAMNKGIWEVHRGKLNEFDEECLLHDKVLEARTEGDCLNAGYNGDEGYFYDTENK